MEEGVQFLFLTNPVEIIGDLPDLMIWLVRERSREIYHYCTVTVFQYIFRNPAEHIPHKIMESQWQLRQRHNQTANNINSQFLHYQYNISHSALIRSTPIRSTHFTEKQIYQIST